MPFEFEKPEFLAGRVLAAAASLVDPHFNQSLVYIAEHSADGALGLVMNRPLGKKLGEVISSSELTPDLAGLPVFIGGPVQESSLVLAIFRRGKNDEDLQCQLG